MSAGTIDVGFLYRNMALNHKLEILELPEQIDLSNPDFEEHYSSVEIKVGRKSYRGRSISYAIAGLKNKNGDEFIDFFRIYGLEILEERGFITYWREVS